MSEYREQCNKRKIEVHIKDPNIDQNCAGKRRRKKSKKIKVMCNPTPENTWKYGREPWCFGRYETVKDAENAIQQKMTDEHYRKYYTFHIEG